MPMRYPADHGKTFVAILILAMFGLLIPGDVLAQVTGATLSGTIRDQSETTIPDATVVVTNVATGVVTTIKADSEGFYAVPNLLPGKYEVAASASGFSTQVQSGVTLTVGAKQVLNFTMKVGELTQKVVVSGEPPTIELGSSSLGGVINSTTVVELPLNGRDWVELTTLEPAVHTIPTQAPASGASNRANRGIGTQLSISGTRPQQDNYRLDGISIEDYAGGGPGSVAGVAMGIDAIREFSVLTSNYSAEYGRTWGASSTQRQGRAAMISTERPIGFSEMKASMPRDFSIRRGPPSIAISLAVPSVVPFRRTRHSFSSTTRVSGRIWE